MPGGDRNGPRGLGPMTGRGAGYCAGSDTPGYLSPKPGFGFCGGRRMGRGFRRGIAERFGRGFGWRTQISVPNRQGKEAVQGPIEPDKLTEEEEIRYLENEKKAIEQEEEILKNEKESVRKRLLEIKG